MIFLLLIFSASSCLANVEKDTSEPSKLFGYANIAYAEGRYQEAIYLYEKIGNVHGVSASLFYNLGNSYAHNGQPGRAIVSYERALMMSYRNHDIVTNLHLLKEKVGDVGVDRVFPKKISRYLVLNHWVILGLAGFAGLLLVYLLSLTLSLARITKLTSIFCTILVIGVSSMEIYTTSRNHKSAVVVKENADLQISPFSGSESRGNVFEGHIVSSLRYHDGYYLVEDKNGRNGWLPESSIELIIPLQR